MNSFVINDSYFEFEKVPADSQGVQFSVQHSYGASRFLVFYLLIWYYFGGGRPQSKEQGAPPPPKQNNKEAYWCVGRTNDRLWQCIVVDVVGHSPKAKGEGAHLERGTNH